GIVVTDPVHDLVARAAAAEAPARALVEMTHIVARTDDASAHQALPKDLRMESAPQAGQEILAALPGALAEDLLITPKLSARLYLMPASRRTIRFPRGTCRCA